MPDPKIKKFEVNEFQKAVANKYGGGDFAHLAEVSDADQLRDEVDNVGDTLFKFLMIELSTKEDCDSLDTALSRLQNARNDIDDAIAAVEALQMTPKIG